MNALLICIALTISLVLGYFVGRRLRGDVPANILSVTLLALSLSFSVYMLAVTGVLTFKLVEGVRVASNDTHEAAPPASAAVAKPATQASASRALPEPGTAPPRTVTAQPDGGAPPGKSGDDQMANAIAAIGTVVAVVTLILTFGTTWFALQLQQVTSLKRKISKELGLVKDERNLSDQERQVRDALLTAKFALLKHLIKGKLSKNPVEAFADWAMQLERLSSNNRETRREGFEKLLVFAPRSNEGTVDSTLVPVVDYTLQCDQLARNRLALDAKIKREKVAFGPDDGLWCLVFDPVERLRHDLFASR